MNTLSNIENFGVVVLAAGQGTRLGCEEKSKVMMEIGGKPIISYIIETLFKVGFRGRQICLVVGFKREKVIDYFGGRVIYAYQDEQLGTAHATYIGMKVLPENIFNVLVLNGDDSAFYKPATLENLIQQHIDNGSMATLLSTTIDSSSFGYGRVVRKPDGMIEIIEKEYLNAENKNTNETSPGTFCFNRDWYVSVFPNMPIIEKLGEYGLPTAFTMAQREGLAVQVIKLEDASEWFGINTLDELADADGRKKLYL
jgi:bifunctional UDP-N-acetylglucosamine pyrophosphorylase/glucosamine-1-phosphate N-acetyltransferase